MGDKSGKKGGFNGQVKKFDASGKRITGVKARAGSLVDSL